MNDQDYDDRDIPVMALTGIVSATILMIIAGGCVAGVVYGVLLFWGGRS